MLINLKKIACKTTKQNKNRLHVIDSQRKSTIPSLGVLKRKRSFVSLKYGCIPKEQRGSIN
jgi:hypothetical protein